MLFRRQTTVCREGWYYLAIVALVFGGAVSKEVNLLLILAGMLLGGLLPCTAQPDPNWLDHDRNRQQPPVIAPATA